MYKIIDCYGTNINVWRYADALQWLAKCSPSAAVVNRFTGSFVCSRIMKEI